jgi:CheY-like chemotaxis protein
MSDRRVHRRLLEELIAGWGMRAESLAASAGALESMRAAEGNGDPFQFVLLDCPASRDEGIAVARAIRSDPLSRHPIVVVLKSSAHARGVAEPLAGMVEASFAKPVRQAQLLQALTNAWASCQGISASPAAMPKAAVPEPATAMPFAAAKSRVLVVEDNSVNQKLLCRLLERLGLRPDVAANGKEAVEKWDLAPYDLVLMDCQMPEMDGYEATRRIRAREGASGQVAVIAITADAMPGTRERCQAAGMNDYITKPVKRDVLLAVLQRWLPQGQEKTSQEVTLS